MYKEVKFEARQNAAAQKSKEETPMNPLRLAINYVNYRRTIAELSNLSNDTLSDIGVNRYQIRNIASRSFR